jgi:hypothetical protein
MVSGGNNSGGFQTREREKKVEVMMPTGGTHLAARGREGRAGGLVGPDSGAGDLGPGHEHGPGGLLSSFSSFFDQFPFSFSVFLFLS